MIISGATKGIFINNMVPVVDKHGDYHLFVSTFQGDIVHIMPYTGKWYIVVRAITNNSRPYMTYSPLSDCFYFANNEPASTLIEYNNRAKSVISYNYSDVGKPSSAFSATANTGHRVYNFARSEDGHIYIGEFGTFTVGGYMRFNVITKEFDDVVTFPDKEFTHFQARRGFPAVKVDNTPFAGVYSPYLFDNNFDELWTVLKSEISAAGFGSSWYAFPYLHINDRTIGSATRRVWVHYNTKWYVVDLKAPSTYLVSGAAYNGLLPTSSLGLGYKDQSNVDIVTTGWTWGTLADYDADTGWSAAWNASEDYCIPRKVGRYVYVGGYYMGNKQFFYTLPVHPTTKQVILPGVIDKLIGYLNVSTQVYEINFAGAFGFSSSAEKVMFLNYLGTWYFIRPDNNTWQAYDVVANPSGYVRTAINLNDAVYHEGSIIEAPFQSGMIEVVIGKDVYKRINNNSLMPYAVFENFEPQLNEFGYSDTIFKISLDLTEQSVYNIVVNNMRPGNANISVGHIVDTEKILLTGTAYTGTFAVNRDGEEWTLQKHLPKSLSPNGSVLLTGNKMLAYGYIGNVVVDYSDWGNIDQKSISTGDVTEPHHVCERNGVVMWSGNHVRQSAYYVGHRLSWYVIGEDKVEVKTSVLPDYMNTEASVTMRRNTLALPNSTYTDAQCETALSNYITASGLTRSAAIAKITSLCRYKSAGMVSYANYTIFGLDYVGLALLSGIRFETTVGSGVWVNNNYLNEVNPAMFAVVNIADIQNVAKADFKLISILGTTDEDYQRVWHTDDYVCFIRGGQNGKVWIVAKADIAAANNGDSVTATSAEYDFGTNGSFGDNVYFNNTGTQYVTNFASKGNILYATCYSNTNLGGGEYAAIIKVDCSANTISVFAKSATKRVRTLTINSSDMLIGDGTNALVIDSFESEILPITI